MLNAESPKLKGERNKQLFYVFLMIDLNLAEMNIELIR